MASTITPTGGDLNLNGNIGVTEAAPVTPVEITHATPYITLHNSASEDTDGGRESRLIARGQQSGAEESVLGYLEFAHDGSSDDEKGKFAIKLNDGNDGTAPSKTVIEGLASGYARAPLGLLFGSDTAAANALDDYEEGSWTASLGGTATYTGTPTGYYTKIGNVVFITLNLVVNTIGTGSATTINGLPFASVSGATSVINFSYFDNINTSVVQIAGYLAASSTSVDIYSLTAAAAATSLNSIFKNSTNIHIAGFYRV